MTGVRGGRVEWRASRLPWWREGVEVRGERAALGLLTGGLGAVGYILGGQQGFQD